MALISFTSVTYAQNTKSCCCRHKTAYHKAVHHKIKKVAKANTDHHDMDMLYAVPSEETPCYMYQKSGVAVMECPDVFYDQSGNVAYIIDHVYTGNYPVANTVKAVQQAPANDYSGRPESSNLCFWDCR
jgi:hypothetical protein